MRGGGWEENSDRRRMAITNCAMENGNGGISSIVHDCQPCFFRFPPQHAPLSLSHVLSFAFFSPIRSSPRISPHPDVHSCFPDLAFSNPFLRFSSVLVFVSQRLTRFPSTSSSSSSPTVLVRPPPLLFVGPPFTHRCAFFTFFPLFLYRTRTPAPTFPGAACQLTIASAVRTFLPTHPQSPANLPRI